jgi:membrane-associated protease RseP (regulator of RpoE activity)
LDSNQPADHDPGLTPPPAPGNGGPPPDEPIDDAQLSPRAWVARNGFTLLLVLAGLVAIYYKFGLEGMWTIAKVAIGLGAVIFIHELGHFLVAKWCDVHVQTFSIGFGPALPGCIYKWGETTYKIALFPLGGYVKMVGEGGENDEEDTDPRSYKNKSVGQRMAIISAGVVMNILFGLVVFIIAFNIGVHQTAPVVGVIETGGPAWQEGVRPGDRFLEVNGVKHPYFEDLKVAVMLSDAGERVPFLFEAPGRSQRSVTIEPRKTKGENRPIIGLNPPAELKLPAERDLDRPVGPVMRGSAAAAARALDLKPDDTLLAATNPILPGPAEAAARDSITDLDKHDPAGDLAQRLLALAGKPVQVKVRRAGSDKEETITLEAGSGFQFDDEIVGTSDPKAGSPFQTAPLEKDPRDPSGRHLDYFEFLNRLGRMADRPVVIQVRRKGTPADAKPVNVFVPPAYHRVIAGARMVMGSVTALRKGSTAEAQGLKVDDVIVGVALTDGKESVTFSLTPTEGERQLDPLRLPFDLRQWAGNRQDVRAAVKVRRMKDHNPNAVEEVTGLEWDGSWGDQGSLPMGVTSSLPISELGVAYQVKAQVAAVEPGSPAAKAGLRAEDFILSWNSLQTPRKAGQEPKWPDKPVNLRPEDNPNGDPDPYWASAFYMMQTLDYDKIKLEVRHTDGPQPETIELELQPDPTWPQLDSTRPRGLRLIPYQDRLVRADNLGEAVQMGMRYTYRTIAQIYMSLKALVTQRVSATENLQGPIDIAYIAYKQAGADWADFLLLLGLISVNLAVVNFLPIPILDGGHMVFLIYEKLRGRPAGESVRLAANWFGLLVLASLMIFVVYLGFSRYIWPRITGG